MTQEFDEAAQDPKDFTKYIWAGVGILILAMILFMVFNGKTKPRRSEVETKHILIRFDHSDPADRARALELVQDLRKKIVNGEASFEAVAEEYSDDPQTGPNGGYLGTHGKGEMSDQYDKYAWTAPIGELSGIIQTSYGYHLMVVIDRYISPGDEYEEKLEERVRDVEIPVPGNDATE